MKRMLLSFALAALVAAPLTAAPMRPAAKGKEGRPYVDKMLQVPEVKAAQEKVWDARLALYGAQHDRALAGIAYHRAEVLKNNPADKAEKLKRLDEAKTNADKTYELKKQLVAAERAQDWDKVKSIHQEMMKVRMGNRAAMKGGRPGPAGGAQGGPGAGLGMPMWGDENE